MGNKNELISVIIPAYNEENYLGRTLEYLLKAKEYYKKLTGKSVEIIVVNNNSEDKTSKIAKKYNTLLVFEPINNIARARNAGAKRASGNYLVFLDADTLVCEDFLYKLQKVLSNEDYLGGDVFIYLDGNRKVWKLLFKFVNYLSYIISFRGACIFCKREAFDEIGGFEESFYVFDDVVFCFRLKMVCFRRKKKFCHLKNLHVVTSDRNMGFNWLEFFRRGGLKICINPRSAFREKKCWFKWYENRKVSV